MKNLAQLISGSEKTNPEALFGTLESHSDLSSALQRAAGLAKFMNEQGFKRGSRWALIGPNSDAYMLTWMAAQLAGVELALLNPEYPAPLLRDMLDDLRPDLVVWLDHEPIELSHADAPTLDLRSWWDDHRAASVTAPIDVSTLDGWHCEPTEISAYIHTSGTTGRPKFCALSHDYFIRLGRFFADTLCLGRHDRVFAPLSMYHINPLGYGVVGALTARASVLGTNRFSASKFWPAVKEHRFTAVVLHPSIAMILATKTTPEDSAGHEVRVAFSAEIMLCGYYDIPVGVCGFGSTEAGGLCHAWHYRATDALMCKEGSSNYAGRARYDVDWTISPEGEILVRAKAGQSIVSGYIREGEVVSALDEDGWFHTGDRGRKDEFGNLVFIERLSEAIRVKGEYVPIDFVETKLAACRSLAPFALWRKDSSTTGHQVVVYTESAHLDLNEFREAIASLPGFMQPEEVIQIGTLPRVGANKVARNQLAAQPVLSALKL
jgi:acyl-CoA synthetase (AMP-forming)/AMP-acid ligase II